MGWGAPSTDGIHRAMESALARGVEGIHDLPRGVLLADRDRHGRWGEAGAYYAYCVRCGAWLELCSARAHRECDGRYGDGRLERAAAAWDPKIQEMRAKVQRGEDPYYGFLDLRDRGSPDGRPPSLVPGRRQLLRIACPPVAEPLEVMLDVPEMSAAEDDGGSNFGVLLYFHGSGEDCRQAPRSSRRRVVIAAQCPRLVDGVRCFWFEQGSGGAWERHEHDKLERCLKMLAAVAHLVEVLLTSLRSLVLERQRHVAVDRRLCVMGQSMGGYAALEFARHHPELVHSVAAISGYYPPAHLPGLVRAISGLPLILVHRRSDRCCPFWMIEDLHRARLDEADQLRKRRCWVGATEAWFSDGDQHGPTYEEMDEVIEWLWRCP
eukprot:TRINITY_DN12080_c0_g1_i1.p1 TRINITY_DN12080_c0_g1~~TRINITY_DN12080_c0_g1_i1.p1  ORF type:complete len:415 (+),score=79.85 TRINITY_DN12080_c0_g1_i1:111-1247(+)